MHKHVTINQWKIEAMVYSHWLLLVFIKIINLNGWDTATLNVCFYPDSTISSFAERNTQNTHNDGQKGIIEDSEKDILYNIFYWNFLTIFITPVFCFYLVMYL